MSHSVCERMEINLTMRCFYDCKWCARGLDIRQFPSGDVMLSQVFRLLGHLRECGIRLSRLKLSGGEPTMHPDFQRILNKFVRHRGRQIRKLVIQTSRPRPYVRRKFRIARNVGILSDPPPKDLHEPFFISPVDLHLTGKTDEPRYGTHTKCKLQRVCGQSFETWGFTACAEEGTLGRLLGINPYRPTYKFQGDPNICRHCLYSLPPKLYRPIRKAAKDGEIRHPSATYRRTVDDLDVPRW
jgi:hypothetical protein